MSGSQSLPRSAEVTPEAGAGSVVLQKWQGKAIHRQGQCRLALSEAERSPAVFSGSDF